MSLHDFAALNERRAEAGESTFMNPRNSAAGTIRQLDPALAAARPLSFWCYQVGVTEGLSLRTHWEALEWLRAHRFPVNRDIVLLEDEEEVIAQCVQWEQRRGGLDFEIDGAVVKVSDLELQRRLGSVGRDPRWAVAWKFAPTTAVTRLRSIGWNPGRSGRSAPLRGARSGVGRRRHDQACHAPQRGGPAAQGHPRRRGRDRAARGRRDPAGDLAGAARGGAQVAAPAAPPSEALPVLQHEDGQARGLGVHALPQPRMPGAPLAAAQALRLARRDGHRGTRREAGGGAAGAGARAHAGGLLPPERGAAAGPRGLRRDLRAQPPARDRGLARATVRARALRARDRGGGGDHGAEPRPAVRRHRRAARGLRGADRRDPGGGREDREGDPRSSSTTSRCAR